MNLFSDFRHINIKALLIGVLVMSVISLTLSLALVLFASYMADRPVAVLDTDKNEFVVTLVTSFTALLVGGFYAARARPNYPLEQIVATGTVFALIINTYAYLTHGQTPPFAQLYVGMVIGFTAVLSGLLIALVARFRSRPDRTDLAD